MRPMEYAQDDDEVISNNRVYPTINHRDKWVLAPMVHAGVLPFRLLCLDYGADLVYTEEIIDRSLINTFRHVDKALGTVEYINRTKECLVYSTSQAETDKNVLQLGTADSVLALQASEHVIRDVACIDINMGCPKSFSVKGGMGAALLSSKEKASDILKTLSRNLPCQVTCKIRLFPSTAETIDFMKLCEMSGASAIAVHLRQVQHRPTHRAQWNIFADIASNVVNVPVIANGDFLSLNDIKTFLKMGTGTSVMIARGALRNPSIFRGKQSCVGVGGGGGEVSRPDGNIDNEREIVTPRANLSSALLDSGTASPIGEDVSRGSTPGSTGTHSPHPWALPQMEVIQSYLKVAVPLNSPYQSLKWIVSKMLEKSNLHAQKDALRTAKNAAAICQAFELSEWYDAIHSSLPEHANTTQYYAKKAREAPKRTLPDDEGDGKERDEKEDTQAKRAKRSEDREGEQHDGEEVTETLDAAQKQEHTQR